jgi:hypothetical protein
VLHWDFAGDGDTFVKDGDTIIFAEPALYEGYKCFIEVAEIVRSRHGAAVLDLIPTRQTEIYLYGHQSSSPQMVDAARKRIFI